MKQKISLLLIVVTLMFSLEAAAENFTINLPFFIETEHFELYCHEQDREVSAMMVQNLENRFEEITSRYRFIPEQRIRVGIYPDSDSFLEATGRPQAPKWNNERWSNGLMLMVSPNALLPVHSYRSYAVLAPLDTFVGSILAGRYGHSPSWLQVGVPLFESGRWVVEEKERGKAIMNEYIEQKGFPKFEDLENEAYFHENRFSPFAATLVAFIMQTKGFNALLALLEDYSRIEEIMGQSKEGIRDAWIEFLRKEYLKDVA